MSRLPTPPTKLVLLAAGMAVAPYSAAFAASGVTIVKQPGNSVDQMSPMMQALIPFGIGVLVIGLLVFMINMILMKGLNVNPLASSRFALLGGLLALYCLFGFLFAPFLMGGAKIVMYLCLAALAVGSVFVLVSQRHA